MTKMIYWAIIVVLIIMIALIIWLLAKGSGTLCDDRGTLNSSCSENCDCNTGLTCSSLNGTNGVCKVASGGVCETDVDCGNGLSCQNGVCLGKGGGLNDPCPCGEGYTCVNNVCKIAFGNPCKVDSDCADGNCVNNVCVTMIPPNTNLTDLVQAAAADGIITSTELEAIMNVACKNNGCSDSDLSLIHI